MNRTYIAIDLKSYYASVECVERGLDPLQTNLVVADASRTDKTICLAVSPSLKSYGIPGRARLFEAIQKITLVNDQRRRRAPGHQFTGKSYNNPELLSNPSLELDYIIAPPQMAKYMEISTQIYKIYLKYLSPDDIHVYSIDEVFADVTAYLKTYQMSARDLAMTMILDVLKTTGITATCGIGSNMYLAKVAMDIEAKHIEADENGVRIAELNEHTYRQKLWDHKPLTDFWRVGPGYASKLEAAGLYTMGDIALCSTYNEDALFRMFGVNAGLLVDHAWGLEPCTIADVKAYRPATNSLSSGQVLHRPYTFEETRIILREMAQLSALDLLSKRLVTNQLTLTIGYDIENLKDASRRAKYNGVIKKDHYGREVPKHSHGTENLKRYTSSCSLIIDALLKLYDRIADRSLLIRRVAIGVNKVIPESQIPQTEEIIQFDLFTDPEQLLKERAAEEAALEREKRMQLALLSIQGKYGKNAILTGTNYMEGATTRERNQQIGGHRA